MILCEECVKTFGKGNAQTAEFLMVTESALTSDYRAKLLCGEHALVLMPGWWIARLDVYTDNEDRAYPPKQTIKTYSPQGQKRR